MSSFNNIEKFKYNQNKDDVVSLREYIVFDDEDEKKKFILFKFTNNVNQILHEFKFELKQYDENDNLVETLVFSYNQLNEVGLSEFVPEAKVKVNYLCKEISIRLIYAKFESVYWENDEFTKIPYTFDEYKDSKNKNINTKKIEKQKAITKSKKKKSYFNKVDISKKNKVVIPIIFKVFNTILIIASVIVISYLYKYNKKEFSDEYLNYEIVNDYAVVTSKNCNDIDITIPEKVYGYEVKEIKEYAFENSNIESINVLANNLKINKNAFKNSSIKDIKGDIGIICEYAFDNCLNLEEVVLESVTDVMKYAFINCTNLTKLDVSNATLYSKALYKCENLGILYFKTTSCEKIGDIFSVTNSNLPKKLYYVATHMERINDYFFAYVNGVTVVLERFSYINDKAFENASVYITYF